MSDDSPPFDWRAFLASAALLLFVLAVTIGGFCWGVSQGFYSLGVSALAAAYLLGSE